MTIIELKEKIDEKTNQSILLHKPLRDIHNELTQLRSQFEQLEMQEFLNYLQLEEEIELDVYYSFRGFSSDKKASLSFISGEKFKISKKNKKSIVIEVTKKFKRQWDEVVKKSVVISEFNPGWKIRIELDSFYHFYFKNKKNKSAFDSYIKRKIALDNLLSE